MSFIIHSSLNNINGDQSSLPRITSSESDDSISATNSVVVRNLDSVVVKDGVGAVPTPWKLFPMKDVFAPTPLEEFLEVINGENKENKYDSQQLSGLARHHDSFHSSDTSWSLSSSKNDSFVASSNSHVSSELQNSSKRAFSSPPVASSYLTAPQVPEVRRYSLTPPSPQKFEEYPSDIDYLDDISPAIRTSGGQRRGEQSRSTPTSNGKTQQRHLPSMLEGSPHLEFGKYAEVSPKRQPAPSQRPPPSTSKKGPFLITSLNQVGSLGYTPTKGMKFNQSKSVWEGNEETLRGFDSGMLEDGKRETNATDGIGQRDRHGPRVPHSQQPETPNLEVPSGDVQKYPLSTPLSKGNVPTNGRLSKTPRLPNLMATKGDDNKNSQAPSFEKEMNSEKLSKPHGISNLPNQREAAGHLSNKTTHGNHSSSQQQPQQSRTVTSETQAESLTEKATTQESTESLEKEAVFAVPTRPRMTEKQSIGVKQPLLPQKEDLGWRESQTLSWFQKSLSSKYAEGWSTMKHLNLSQCQLEDIPEIASAWLPLLEELCLDENRIRKIPSFPLLKKLSLRQNKLSSLCQLINEGMALQSLELQDNFLQDLRGCPCTGTIQHLDISQNHVSSFQVISVEFCQLKKLVMRGNHIRELALSEDIPSLEHLDLSNNKMTDAKGIEILSSLQYLDLSRNFLNSWQLTRACRSLLELNLNDNRLESLDGRGLSTLSVLRLQNNLFSFESNHHLWDLSLMGQLRKLDLSGNKLKRLTGQHVKSASLEHLKVKHCLLKELDLGSSFPSLKVLHAESNALTEIKGGKETVSTVLQRLYLLDNEIKQFHVLVDLVKGCPSLLVLDIRVNPVTAKFYPNVGLLAKLSNLKKKSVEDVKKWKEMDDVFLKELSDVQYMRRVAHRSSVICLGKQMKELDGIDISEKDRKKAQQTLEKMTTGHKIETDHRPPATPQMMSTPVKVNMLQTIPTTEMIQRYSHMSATPVRTPVKRN